MVALFGVNINYFSRDLNIMNKLITTLAGFALLGSSSLVSALPLMTGQIEIGADIGSTVSVDFTNDIVSFGGPGDGDAFNAVITFADGDYASFMGTQGSYQNFAYNPLSVANPIWTFGTLSFDLTNITFMQETIGAWNGDFLDLAGFGWIKDSTGTYADTSGTWTFNANKSTGKTTFAFSSTTAPEPGVALLLAAGLIGIGAARRARKAA